MARTLIRIFLETVATHHKPAQFLRMRNGRWEPISAGRALEDVESLGIGLRDLGVRPGDHVALLSENRYEWAVADLAVLGIGAVTVPVYATLTAAQVRHILHDAEARFAIVSNAAQFEKLRAVRAELPRLETVITVDPVPEPGPGTLSWELVTGRGAIARSGDALLFRSWADAVRPDDLATIIYTSGTSGEPKGAMLTHDNIVSNVDACLQVVDLGPTDVALSFLPLSHIFERMAGLYAMLRRGVTIAYAQGMETVAADAAQVRPTVLTAVPRFYEKVYVRVVENALSQSALRRDLFFWGLRQGVKRARAHFAGRRHHSVAARLADALVGSRVRHRFGGRLRFCISGGAPLAPKVLEFFFAMGIPIVEGYGLTETSPVICLNPPGRERPGSVGPPIPGVEVRIGEEGEILTRGRHVMRGYWRNSAATAAALEAGWFHTGDVGHLDDDGYLHITDRLKDLLVTAGGKKVAPQPLENRLKTSKWVSDVVLVGDRRPYVSTLIVPNFKNLEHHARAQHWPFGTRQELLALAGVQALYQRELDRLNADLAPFEQVKRFTLLDRELAFERGELTPTLKLRRREIAANFAEAIERLYPAGQTPAGV